jgi:YidC/Oxa1 family membrane protein insertase
VAIALAWLAAVAGAPAQVSAEERDADRLRVVTEHLDLVFSLEGGNPISWRACHPSCAPGGRRAVSVDFAGKQDAPQARLRLRGPGTAIDLDRLRFMAETSEDAKARVVTFQADLPLDGVRLVKSFAVSREAYDVILTVELRGANAAPLMAGRRLELELEAGHALFPPPSPGFAGMLEHVQRVVVGPHGVRVVGDRKEDGHSLGPADWAGIRNRFWVLALRPDGAASMEPRPGEALTVAMGEPAPPSWRFRLYSGPVELNVMRAEDPELGRLFLSGLWWWLRALSLGLFHLLRGLTAVIGHPGVAIIALAGAVKLLLLPLTLVAGKLQDQVNATQARLQPGLDAINAAHRGEERTRRTLALYREAGVHPLYALKSLVGFLIQVPVFIAVFDMLAEDFDLLGVPFLWIRDLSQPDHLARLSACVPFFGCHLNLLPFLMSGISIAASLRHRSTVLPPALARKQRRNLTAMALAFFLLFYTFPACMVLYWTSTNAVQLLSQEIGHAWRHLRRAPQS